MGAKRDKRAIRCNQEDVSTSTYYVTVKRLAVVLPENGHWQSMTECAPFLRFGRSEGPFIAISSHGRFV
jgi:hypothetical protein